MAGWRKTFWAVWIANLVTAAGMMSFLPFFPSHLRALGIVDRGEVAVWAGVLFGAAPLSAALTSPMWGALGDRFGRKLMVLRSMLAITVFVGAMAFATTPLQLLVLRLLQGVFSGFVAPSLTLVSVQAPEDSQSRISASLQQAMTIGAVLGPVLGGFVREGGGLRAAYLSVAGLALLGALCVLLFAHEDPAHRQPGAGRAAPLAALRESFGDLGELRANRALRAAVVLTFWIQFGISATNPLLELFVEDLHAQADSILPVSTALLFSAMAAANLLAVPLWGRAGDRRGAYGLLVACSLVSGVALAAHALARSYGFLLGARIALGAATAGSGPLAFGVAAAETSVDRRGGAFGLVFAARALAVALAAMLGGAVSTWLGLRGLFACGGALLIGAAWTFRRRGGPAAPGPELAAEAPADAHDPGVQD